MIIEVKVPSVGESVTEAVLAQWFKKDGDRVNKGAPLFVIETDKVTLEVEAEATGVLSIKVAEGETVPIGAVVGTIDSEGAPAADLAPESQVAPETVPESKEKPAEMEAVTEMPTAAPATQAAVRPTLLTPEQLKGLPPSVRRIVSEKHIDITAVVGTGPGGRITKGDVLLYLESGEAAPDTAVSREPQLIPEPVGEETTSRKPMTPIRQRIAARLLESKQNTAMLTTFNDVDMECVMSMRSQYKEAFKKKYDVSLGFMSFFIKACVEALKVFPEVNAFIDGKEIVYHHYYHIGVAIGTGKGLVVPVIRHADKLSMADMERAIVDYVVKIKENRLDLADLEGGTFTITNGGVFGSLLSTPILNTPQSAILGMHRIEKRPVVIDDEIVVRPIMYLALSYDHRIIDGREAVTFLRRIKEFIENPERMILEI